MAYNFRLVCPSFSYFAICCITLLLSIAPPRTEPTLTDRSAPARRIIASYPILTAYLSIDQEPAHVVGASDLPLIELSKVQWLWESLGGHTLSIPTVGYGFILSPERVLRLSPDALFVPHGAADYWVALGLPNVVEVGLDAQALERSRLRIWKRMGEVSGRSERADHLWKKAHVAMRSIRSAVESSGKRTVSAMVLKIDTRGEVTKAGRGSTFAARLTDKGVDLRP